MMMLINYTWRQAEIGYWTGRCWRKQVLSPCISSCADNTVRHEALG